MASTDQIWILQQARQRARCGDYVIELSHGTCYTFHDYKEELSTIINIFRPDLEQALLSSNLDDNKAKICDIANLLGYKTVYLHINKNSIVTNYFFTSEKDALKFKAQIESKTNKFNLLLLTNNNSQQHLL